MTSGSIVRWDFLGQCNANGDDLDDDANADARAEKQKRVDVCVGFLNDNKNKAEEMRQVVHCIVHWW